MSIKSWLKNLTGFKRGEISVVPGPPPRGLPKISLPIPPAPQVGIPSFVNLESMTSSSSRPEARNVKIEFPESMPFFDRVEKRAYYLWQAAGSPEGDDAKFWLAAEKSEMDQLRDLCLYD